MTATLGELKPIGAGDSIELTKERLLIGSHRLCDIIIHSPHVAPVQCELVVRDSWWYVRNLSNAYPTKVNAISVAEDRLDPGDILWISPKHKYEVRYDPDALDV